MNILHLTHGLFGANNGVDIYLETFINTVTANHFIAVPEGKNNSSLPNVCEISSLENLPLLMELLKIDVLIIHWTGGEAFIKDSVIKFGDKFLRNGSGGFTLDTSPYSFLDVTGLFDPEEKKHKTVILSHACYEMPLHMTCVNVDAIIHVSHKAHYKNRFVNNKHFVIYPCLAEKFTREPVRIQSDKIRIGWLGRLDKYDSEIFYYLKNNYSDRVDLEFIFAGKNEGSDFLKNAPENFKFPGNMEQLEFFKNIDIFLYATRIDSFSLSLLEAASQGVYCIASEEVKELAKSLDITVYENIEKLDRALAYAIRRYEKIKSLEWKPNPDLTKKDDIGKSQELADYLNYIFFVDEIQRKKTLRYFSPEVFKRNWENLLNNLVHSI